MTAFVTAGAGFLLAVLWFDLMFDVQVLRDNDRELPAEALESISAYYRRVTTAARPMNLLIVVVMAGMLGAILAQIATEDLAAWAGWASLALGGSAIALAGTHTYPAAVRLGQRADPMRAQLRLARSIGRDHLLCLAAITSLLAIQLAAGGSGIRWGRCPSQPSPRRSSSRARTGSSAGCWSTVTGHSAAR